MIKKLIMVILCFNFTGMPLVHAEPIGTVELTPENNLRFYDWINWNDHTSLHPDLIAFLKHNTMHHGILTSQEKYLAQMLQRHVASREGQWISKLISTSHRLKKYWNDLIIADLDSNHPNTIRKMTPRRTHGHIRRIWEDLAEEKSYPLQD